MIALIYIGSAGTVLRPVWQSHAIRGLLRKPLINVA